MQNRPLSNRLSAQLYAPAAHYLSAGLHVTGTALFGLFRAVLCRTGLCQNQLRRFIARKSSKKLVVKLPAFSYLLPQPHLSGAGANWICPKVHVPKQYNKQQTNIGGTR
jgi:hypothetical protein